MKYLWTTINVRNMNESVTFYTNLTDLKLLKRFPAGPGSEIAFLGYGADDETLVELLAEQGKSEPDHGEAISLGFAVNSMEEMLAKVKSENIRIHSGPFETPGYKFFCIKDPNGLNVQFFEKK